MLRHQKSQRRRRVEQMLVHLLSRLADLLERRLSLRTLRRIATGFGYFIYLLAPSRQRLAERNLIAVFGDGLTAAERKRIRVGVTCGVCKTLVEVLKLPYLSDDELRSLVRLEGTEHITEGLKPGRGVILLTAHFENWEFGGARLAIEGFPVHIVARIANDKLTASLIARARKSKGLGVITRDDTYAMMKALRRNECLAILPDQRAFAGGLRLNFLGLPAMTHRGPARFAEITGCAVVPSFMFRESNGGLICRFYPPLQLAATEDRDANISANTQLFNDVISEQIRQRPEQWLWLHDRWRELDA